MSSAQSTIVPMAHNESRLNINCLNNKNSMGSTTSPMLSHIGGHIPLPYYKSAVETGNSQIHVSGCTAASPTDFTTGCNDINTSGHGYSSPRYQATHMEQHGIKMEEYCGSPGKEEAPVVYPWMKRVHTNTGEKI